MPHSTMDWNSIPSALHAFVAHGVEFSQMGKDQWRGTAPFSDKDDKFYVDPRTGQWDEKQTSDSGNVVTFLEKMVEHYEEGLTTEAARMLAKSRGLPVSAMRGWRLGYDGEQYMLPVYSDKGRVRDIRRFSFKTKRWMATKGRGLSLGGVERLSKARKGCRVWVCEGEADAFALRFWLKKLGKKKDVVLWLPGASVFKKEWMALFKGKNFDLIFVYDNDEPGDKGATKVREMFHNANIPLRYINWPDHWEDGYDVNDFVAYALKNKVGLDVAWDKFETLISEVHRRDGGLDESSAVPEEARRDAVLSEEEAPTFGELVESMRSVFSMDDQMQMLLRMLLSVIMSNKLPGGEPLWFYVVSPAGGGKTALMSMLSTSSDVILRSRIDSTTLVSGYKGDRDPSLLPKLDGKTLMVKDFTGTLAGADHEFENTMGIFRDAFDGDYVRDYGNGEKRHYTDIHFSMIAGVTPAIHSKSMSIMGERFLKYIAPPPSPKDHMQRLMSNLNRFGKKPADDMAEVQEVARKFLATEFSPEMAVPMEQEFGMKVYHLSQVLSALRAGREVDKYDRGVLLYRPSQELGTRPFFQMTKLAAALVKVHRMEEYTEQILRILQQVVIDSCTGFNVELVQEMMKDSSKAWKVSELSEKLNLSTSTMYRTTDDMASLGLLVKRARDKKETVVVKGRKGSCYVLSPDMIGHWTAAGLPHGKLMLPLRKTRKGPRKGVRVRRR